MIRKFAQIRSWINPSTGENQRTLINGSLVFFFSATIVNLGNYFYNLVLGRWLGPASFSDLSIVITLFLIVIFFAASLQTITARFSAIHTENTDLDQIAILRKTMMRWAWGVGWLLAAGLWIGAPSLQHFFNTQSSVIFTIFGFGLPFYLAQGVNRGVLQGQTRFGALSISYQAEMWARLITGVGFTWAGFGTIGAVTGLSMSFVAAWLVSQQAGNNLPEVRPLPFQKQGALFSYTGSVSLTYLSQILITNSDIIIVKHFFPAEVAGQYAALALIGRVLYFATWAITTTLFPIVAQRNQSGRSHVQFLILGCGLVISLFIATLLISWFIPEAIVKGLFGESYLLIAPSLWRYAIAAGLYSLGNVLINYQLSLGEKSVSKIAFIAGVAQVGILWFWHASITQVVNIQIVIMAGLLASLIISYGISYLQKQNPMDAELVSRPL